MVGKKIYINKVKVASSWTLIWFGSNTIKFNSNSKINKSRLNITVFVRLSGLAYILDFDMILNQYAHRGLRFNVQNKAKLSHQFWFSTSCDQQVSKFIEKRMQLLTYILTRVRAF